MEHLNAQMDDWEEVNGPEGRRHVTDNGERLLNLCAANRLKVGGRLLW